MKLRSLSLVLLLLVPSAASASPITSGVWSSMASVEGNGSPFWDSESWDCDDCNVGYLLDGVTGLAGLEYLHDGTGGYVQFRFDNPISIPSLVFSMTGWASGVLGLDAGGAFTYDSGTGRLSDSWLSGQQYALFRRVGTETTQYFLGVEDILLSEKENDRDYNDYGVTFSEPTYSVPEPATLLLLGVSILGLVARKTRQRGDRRDSAGLAT